MTSTGSIIRPDHRPPPLRTMTNYSDRPRSASIKIPGRASPKVSWEETMNDLSRELQQICGSPPSASPMSPYRLNHPLAQASGTSFAFGDGVTSPVTSTPRKITFRGHHGELRRADSVRGQGQRPSQRPIFVRHIETHAELQNRLVEICQTPGLPPTGLQRTGSLSPQLAHAQTPPEWRPQATKTPLDRNSTRIRVNAASHPAEELIVCVRDRRHLAVEAISGSGRMLHQSPLPGGAQVKQLVAQLHDDGVLVIRERPANMAEKVFNNTGSAFIPVVRHDDAKQELTVVLHIPNCFRFEDISVKTVDDRLIVMGRKKVISFPTGVAFNFRSNGSTSPSFRVMLQLPPSVESRTVSATLTKHHQLIVRGKLNRCPRTRRNTF